MQVRAKDLQKVIAIIGEAETYETLITKHSSEALMSDA